MFLSKGNCLWRQSAAVCSSPSHPQLQTLYLDSLSIRRDTSEGAPCQASHSAKFCSLWSNLPNAKASSLLRPGILFYFLLLVVGWSWTVLLKVALRLSSLREQWGWKVRSWGGSSDGGSEHKTYCGGFLCSQKASRSSQATAAVWGESSKN